MSASHSQAKKGYEKILKTLEEDNDYFAKLLIMLKKKSDGKDFDDIIDHLNMINKRIAQQQYAIGLYKGASLEDTLREKKGGSRKSRNNRRATRRR